MSQVPKGAILLERETGVLPIGPLAGSTAVIELWRSMSSQGYKTGYTAVPTYWLVVSYGTKRFLCKQYSTTNPARTAIAQAKAKHDYDANVRTLREANAASK